MRSALGIARLSAGSGLVPGSYFSGWAVSALFHAVVVTAAVALVSDLSIAPPSEPLRIQIASADSPETAARPAAPQKRAPVQTLPEARPVEPQPIVPREITPPVETKVEPVKTPEPAPEELAGTAEAYVQAPTPVEDSEPVAEAVPAEPPAVQTALVPPAIQPPFVEPAAGTAPPPSQASVRADYGWLAEMLWKRVVELKRYPGTARLNGWEGRVVVRAVIQMDGHLTNLSVAESSGYAVLDTAAMDAVRLACPLKLKHQLFGRSTVVVQVPISYTLTN